MLTQRSLSRIPRSLSRFRLPLRRHSHSISPSSSSPLHPFIDLHPSLLPSLSPPSSSSQPPPLIALETAILTHGLPPSSPHHTSLPISLHNIIRNGGAIPVTCAIVDGRIKVGLGDEEVKELCERVRVASGHGAGDGEGIWKVGRRELGAAVMKKVTAGLTVSATMAICSMVGIEIFVTGGIGGVHRGGERTMDISSDLTALADSPVTVICAGPKSILDIGKTLEFLETHSVPVVSYRSNKFPAFYSPDSGFKAPLTADNPTEIAKLIAITRSFPFSHLSSTGILIGNPIPEEFHGVGKKIQDFVERAVEEIERENFGKQLGKEVTPLILDRVAQLTKGGSVESNVGLIENNAKLGVEVGLELGRIKQQQQQAEVGVEGREGRGGSMGSQQQQGTIWNGWSPSSSENSNNLPVVPVVKPSRKSLKNNPLLPPAILAIIGSAAIDITSHPSTPNYHSTTSPGSVKISLGGVARNIAETANKMLLSSSISLTPKERKEGNDNGGEVLLVTPIGDDLFGDRVRNGMIQAGMRTDGLLVRKGNSSIPSVPPFASTSSPSPASSSFSPSSSSLESSVVVGTATCSNFLNEKGELVAGVADMGIVEGMKGKEIIDVLRQHDPKAIAFDANLSIYTIADLISFGLEKQTPTFFEPTSDTKAIRLLSALEILTSRRSDLTDCSPFLSVLTPNLSELSQLFHSLSTDDFSTLTPFSSLDRFDLSSQTFRDATRFRLPKWITEEGVVQMASKLFTISKTIWCKCGSRGVLVLMDLEGKDLVEKWIRYADKERSNQLKQKDNGGFQSSTVVYPRESNQAAVIIKHFTPEIILGKEEQKMVTGAGDTFLGSVLAGVVRGVDMQSPNGLERLVLMGQRAAMATLRSNDAVGDLEKVLDILEP